MAKTTTRILFSNYYWENDEQGKDQYDYAREEIWEMTKNISLRMKII